MSAVCCKAPAAKAPGRRVTSAAAPQPCKVVVQAKGEKLKHAALFAAASFPAVLSAGAALADEAVAAAETWDWGSPTSIAIQLIPLAGYGVYRAFFDPLKQGTATASHILVKEEEKAQELLQILQAEAPLGNNSLENTFARLAGESSTCPSSKNGGFLGTFRPGQMAGPFNDVCFNNELGVVHGPIATQFGYHLIYISERVDKDGNTTKAGE
eukprot:CAMPEP_0182878000 /NCGR_PEP_ID=MMETSP0034_2-20130328/15101_1 /TAXON_ID=156128 /ORGANISM="Nephroselmis pyriformis, Strain CCMP717" /LENGTH=211 /DNA_ID=CAMNT_0025010871 /DNA_START=27 /DNA_END=662 /DNA_ORIENTATION=+